MGISKTVWLPNKFPGEDFNLTFDFIGWLAADESITGSTVGIVVYSGEDDNPNAVLAGAESIEGTTIIQPVNGGVEGVIYRLTVQAETSEDQEIDLIGLLAIVPKSI